MIIIIILVLALMVISLDLFIHASYDARLGFVGAVIGIPASILITVMYNDYAHRRDYLMSIKKDLYNVIHSLQIIEGKAHRLGTTYADAASSSNSKARKMLLSLGSTKSLTDTSVLSELLSSVQTFYKKRKMKCWYLDDSNEKFDAISREEYRSNDCLRPLIGVLAVLEDYSKRDLTQDNVRAIRNTCNKTVRIAKQARDYFSRLS